MSMSMSRGSAPAANRGRGELVDALVEGDAGVTEDLDEPQVGELLRQGAQLRDQLLVGLGLPRLGQKADRVRGVRVHDDRALAVRDLLEPAQDRGELGDLVGALAEILAELALRLA